jgi:hypothetical protein
MVAEAREEPNPEAHRSLPTALRETTPTPTPQSETTQVRPNGGNTTVWIPSDFVD